jgi:hypothetical protein
VSRLALLDLVAAIAPIAACAALALPASGLAQSDGPGSSGPATLVLAGSLAGGAELGLAAGRAGLVEGELLAGLDIEASAAHTGLTLRPELALALGAAPDGHLALRPGLRVAVPETPLWLRLAADWSTARGKHPGWRWVLVGVAWEVRMTSVLGFSAEADTGVPLSDRAGLPLLVRAGVTFRP